MTIHEAAEDAVKAWRDPAREDWRRTLGLAGDTRPLWKALQALGLAVDEYDRHPERRAEYPKPRSVLGDEFALSGPMLGIPMAQVVVRSDGGPWAVHNQPCAVCGQQVAVLDLNEGVMHPCWPCQAKGWDLKCSRPRWWQKRFRSRDGVAE